MWVRWTTLVERQEYPNAIVQTIREPMLVLDGDLRIQLANPAFHRTFHVTPQQTLGLRIYELGNGQWDIPSLRKLLEEILPTDGQFNDYAVTHDFPHIGTRTILLNARRLHDGNDDKSALILLAFEDITERREAEIELNRQRTWFSTTLASIGDAVIATDADARCTFLNPVAERITGWTAQEAQGKPLHEVFNIVNEETRKLVESPVSKAIRMGAVVGLANHTVLISKNGTEWPIDDSAAPIRDEAGRVIGVVMVFHDITDRRASEQLLEISEIRYRRLFEAAHDGILILDEKSRRITDVNPFMLRLLHYPREHFIGKELWEIGVFHDKAESQSAMETLKKRGSVRYENKPLLDRDGRQHAVEVVANVYQEDHSPVIQCNIRDISDRKRLEDERDAHLTNEQLLRMEAENANRAKDMFLATLSHEMRTPLNAIVGWLGILNARDCDDQSLREGLEVITRNTKSQVQLIEDVLDVSRIVSGKLRLEIRPCELVDTIRAGIESVRPSAEARGITLDVDLDPGASPAICDSTRIEQVVWNLVSNAVKFTPPGRNRPRHAEARSIQLAHHRERHRPRDRPRASPPRLRPLPPGRQQHAAKVRWARARAFHRQKPGGTPRRNRPRRKRRRRTRIDVHHSPSHSRRARGRRPARRRRNRPGNRRRTSCRAPRRTAHPDRGRRPRCPPRALPRAHRIGRRRRGGGRRRSSIERDRKGAPGDSRQRSGNARCGRL